jgi:hypothetical protein
MWQLRGPVCIHARLELELRLTFVVGLELSRYQHHPLSRRVPVVRDAGTGRQLEECIRIRFLWIAVKNRKSATRWH